MPTERTNFDSFEALGHWWAPDSSGTSLGGILTFDPIVGISLRIHDEFSPIFSRRGTDRIPIILGVTAENNQITLVDCIQAGMHVSHGQLSSTSNVTYQALYLIIGCHIESIESVKPKTFSTSFTNLEEWIARVPFRFDPILYSFDQSFSIAYKPAEPTEIWVESTNTTISLDFNFYSSGGDYHSLELRQRAYLRFKNHQSSSLTDYIDASGTAARLLTLLIGYPVYARLHHIAYEESSNEDKKKSERHATLYHLVGTSSRPKEVDPFEMLLPFDRIRTEVEVIFNRWFEKQKDLEPLCDLFFGVQYTRGTSLQFKFLSLMQGLENFHRRKYGGTYIGDQEFESIKHSMISSLPGDTNPSLKESLNGRLKYAHEFSLQKRFKDIFKKISPESQKIITVDYKQFIRQIVDSRNYYTHFNKNLESKALEGQELFNTIWRLNTLITILLLSELGLSDELIVNGVKGSRRFRQLTW